MNRGRKILILTFVLLIPAAIYIFLRMFGQNEFTLPVYHEESTVESTYPVDMYHPNPHEIPFQDVFDSQGKLIDKELLSGRILVLDMVSAKNDVIRRNHQIKRVVNVFHNEDSLLFVRLFQKKDQNGIAMEDINLQKHANVMICFAEIETIKDMSSRYLEIPVHEDGINSGDQLILFDTHRRIRGYYNIDDFEEIDRLILEIKILLKQKKNV
jgi:hypothetical protein